MKDNIDKKRLHLNILIFIFIIFFLLAFYLYSRISEDIQLISQYITETTIQQKSIQRNLINIMIKPDLDLELISFNQNSKLYFDTNEALLKYLHGKYIYKYSLINTFCNRAELGFERVKNSKDSFDINIKYYIEQERFLIHTNNDFIIRNNIGEIANNHSEVHNLYYNTILNELRVILYEFENGFIRYFLISIFTILLLLGFLIIITNLSIYKQNRLNEHALHDQLKNISEKDLSYIIQNKDLEKLNVSNKIVFELAKYVKISLAKQYNIVQDFNISHEIKLNFTIL